jgi:alpha-mannosidase
MAYVFPSYGIYSHCPGITGGYGGDRRVEYIIPPAARKQGSHEFVIESSCNGMFGVPWNGDTIAPPDVGLFSP